jgi:3-hydroxyacyl-[acyl-carrier-protein] dehydratase
MPAQPLVDLARLDLSRVRFTRADMQKVLRQRGRFSIVDAVVHLEPDTDFVVAYTDVLLGAWWAEDHIPGRPIFPGVLMVEACAQLGTFDFFQRHPDAPSEFVGFASIDNTRFRAPVEPPARLHFVAKVTRVRKNLFTYQCQGLVEHKIVFEGELTGMAM